MARLGVVSLVLLTAIVVQTSLLPLVSISGFRPDLLLLVTIAFALADGPVSGMRVGFASGLATDLLLNTSPLGLSALVFVGIAYATGSARPYLAQDSWTAPLLFSVFGTLVGVVAYGLLTTVLADEPIGLGLVGTAAIVSALYAALLAPIVTAAVRRLTDQFPIEQPVG